MRTALGALVSILVCSCGSAPTTCPSSPPTMPATTASAAPAAPPAPIVEGAWHGVLVGKLHLGLTLARAGESFTGVLDSIDQGSKLAVEHVVVDGHALRFEVPSVGGTFEGTVDAASSAIDGTWTQSAHAMPLRLERGAPPAAPLPPPLDAPIDVAVVTPPSALRADDHAYFVYELNVTSYSAATVAIHSVDVEARGAKLAHLEGADLAAACGRDGAGDVEIGPGRHAIVFLWITADGPLPKTLEHRIIARVGDRELPVNNVAVAVRDAAPVVVAPPLRGGVWLAGNGPSKSSSHRHALLPIAGHASLAQRFAIDFVKVDDAKKTFHGDPQKNASYYAYGADALAVADGVVTETKDGIAENVPGERAVPITLETIAGNHVVVDLGGGRFAFWAHLQPGSVRVKVGDRVKRGQLLGLVGNSGNSSEPHLHFHVTDAPSPLGSQGIPYAFDTFELRREGKPAAASKKQLPTEDELIVFP